MSVSRKPSPSPLTVRAPEDALLKRPIHRTPGTAKPIRGHRLDARTNLRRMVQRRPEVMVKAWYVSGRKGVRATLRYVSREGALDLVGPDGELIDRDGANDLAKEFTAEHRDGCRDIMHVVVSMPDGPEGPPRDEVRQASEAWAHAMFPDRLHVIAHHTDQDHAHAHVIVAMVGPGGRRMQVQREDLQEWRECFAGELDRLGVEAAATPRDARGQYRKAERGVLCQMREAGRTPEVYVSMERQARQPPGPEPWREAIEKRHEVVKDALQRLADIEPEPMKTETWQFVKDLPERRLLRDQIRARWQHPPREQDEEMER